MVKKFNEFINEDFTDLYKRWKGKETRKEDSLEVKMKDFITSRNNSRDYYIENGKVCCKGDVKINNDDLVDGKFPVPFGRVDGSFICKKCKFLISLEGAPEYARDFVCDNCENLPSLEGAPEIVKRSFSCIGCNDLNSLEGSPRKVDIFHCTGCKKITSLKGAPEECLDFNCNFCMSLESLEGLSKGLSVLRCAECKKKFTESDLPEGITVQSFYNTI